MNKYIKTKFILITVALFLFFINITLVNAATSAIGDKCTQNISNNDCQIGGASLDCEKSSLPGNPMYCTCNNDGDCLTKYGSNPPFTGSWYCWNDNKDGTDLKYCHNDSGDNIFPDKGVPKAFSQPYYVSKRPDGTYECLVAKSAADTPQFASLPLCEPEASKLNDALSPSVGLPGEAGTKTTAAVEDVAPTVAPPIATVEKKLEIKPPKLEINIPQLTFTDIANSIDEQGYLHLPYIGEYMSAIYKISMVAISIIGVIMIIVVGVKITVLGGAERVEGLKKIGKVLIGLSIAWGSYSILYTINPDLVNFSALKVQYIEPLPIPDDIDTSDMEAGMAGGPTVGEKGACDKINTASPPEGWVDLVALCKGDKCAGLSVRKEGDPRENFVAKITADKLIDAGKKAAAQGYVIGVRSKCRSIASQQKIAKAQPGGVSSGTVAKPGNSPHGTGYALDLVLTKGGSEISDGGFSGKNQCKANAQGVAALSSIMYSAGFVRYGAENWHFESQKAGAYCRITGYTGLSPCIPPAAGAARCPIH